MNRYVPLLEEYMNNKNDWPYDEKFYYHSSNYNFSKFDIINHNNSGNFNDAGYGIHVTPEPNSLEGEILYQIRVPKDTGDNYLMEGEQNVFNDIINIAAKYGVDINRFMDKPVKPNILIKYMLTHECTRPTFLKIMQESKYVGFRDVDGYVRVIYNDDCAYITDKWQRIK